MSTLTDRYVHATTRYLSSARQEDIARELTASIDDMIVARVDAGDEREVAEHAVLTDLGNPDVLAAKYADQPLHLIGPRFFLIYLRLLIVLLATIPPIVGVISALADAGDGASAGAAIGHGVVVIIQTAVNIGFCTTLVFAILDRVGAGDSLPVWTPDKLPELPQRRLITLGETIGSVVFTTFIVVVLIGQHFWSWAGEDSDGDRIAMLNPDLWSFWLPLLIAALLASILVDLWKYAVGHYTWSIVGGVAITSLVWLIPVVWLASQDRLLNAGFTSALDMSASVVDRVNVGIIVVAIAVEVFTIGEALVKSVRARATPAAG